MILAFSNSLHGPLQGCGMFSIRSASHVGALFRLALYQDLVKGTASGYEVHWSRTRMQMKYQDWSIEIVQLTRKVVLVSRRRQMYRVVIYVYVCNIYAHTCIHQTAYSYIEIHRAGVFTNSTHWPGIRCGDQAKADSHHLAAWHPPLGRAWRQPPACNSPSILYLYMGVSKNWRSPKLGGPTWGPYVMDPTVLGPY